MVPLMLPPKPEERRDSGAIETRYPLYVSRDCAVSERKQRNRGPHSRRDVGGDLQQKREVKELQEKTTNLKRKVDDKVDGFERPKPDPDVKKESDILPRTNSPPKATAPTNDTRTAKVKDEPTSPSAKKARTGPGSEIGTC